MTVVVNEKECFVSVELQGELRADLGEDLREAIAKRVSQDAIRLVINLQPLHMIDCRVIALLIGVMKQTREAGMQLAIVSEDSLVKEWHQLSQLMGTVLLCDSESQVESLWKGDVSC